MSGRWLDTRLGEVLTLQRGFDLPADKRRPGRFPVIASTGIAGTHCEPMVKGPGVVIGRSGSLGGAQYVPDDFWPLNTTLWVKDFKGNNRRFCYYLLKSLDLQTLNVGSGVPTLNRNHVHPLPVRVPSDVEEQRAIAHILGTLDDKIELNRRMNETLEAMARALFKSWFIDFDPVHAKAEGRDPGLPADIAALFPDSFEDSELGEIPKGWTAGEFGNIVSQRTERLRDRSAVVLSAMAAGELVKSEEHFTKRVYSQDIGKYLAVEQWDFAYNPSRVNIGSIGMLKEPLLGGVSPVYVVFRPQAAYRWFVEFNLRQPSTKQWINTLASGSVRQSLSYADFASLPCVIPPETTIARFDEAWAGLRASTLLRSDESRTLATLRDTLLPKLLSGELRVKDVDELAEAHV